MIDQYGNDLGGAEGFDDRTFQIPQAGLYFVRIFLFEDNAPFKLTAAWGSNSEGLLQNGVPLALPGGAEFDTLLASVYLPAGTQALMLQTGMESRVFLEVIDQYGNDLGGAEGFDDRTFQIPHEGLYFVRIFLFEGNAPFKLTAAWGANGQGQLQNGVPLAFPGGVEFDTLLTSIYVPEGTLSLTLQTSNAAMLQLELIDETGHLVWGGSAEQNESIQIPHPGLYFVRMLLWGAVGEFSVTAQLVSAGDGVGP